MSDPPTHHERFVKSSSRLRLACLRPYRRFTACWRLSVSPHNSRTWPARPSQSVGAALRRDGFSDRGMKPLLHQSADNRRPRLDTGASPLCRPRTVIQAALYPLFRYTSSVLPQRRKPAVRVKNMRTKQTVFARLSLSVASVPFLFSGQNNFPFDRLVHGKSLARCICFLFRR